jgi:hypothetical protein
MEACVGRWVAEGKEKVFTGLFDIFEFHFWPKIFSSSASVAKMMLDSTIIFVDAFGKCSKSHKIGFFWICARTELAKKGVEPSHLKFLLKN